MGKKNRQKQKKQASEAASGSNPTSNSNASNLEELSARELVAISKMLLAQGNVAKSEAVLKMALSKDPEYDDGLIAMSVFLIFEGKFAEALKFLEHLLSKPCPEHPLGFCHGRVIVSKMAASCFLNLGKPYEAIGCLEPLTSITEPENPVENAEYFAGIAMLGEISFTVGRMDDAVKCEKKMFAKMGPAEYARRILHLPPGYKEFVESLKYV